MRFKYLRAGALVAVGALAGSAVTYAQAQTAVPTQSQALASLDQVRAYVQAHPDATSTTSAATTTTTRSPSSTGVTTTTRAPATTTTTRAPATTTSSTAAPPSGLRAQLRPGVSWDWQIGGTPSTAPVDNATGAQKMLDVDMEGTGASVISSIHSRNIIVVCYIEVGSWEDYRPDASKFPQSALGLPLDPPYQNERYLNVTDGTVETLIKDRITRAAQKGCDGIEPDLDDTWAGGPNGDTGFNLAYSEVLAYNHRLAEYAHSLGLMYGLKNASGTRQVQDSVSFTDFALSEQCRQFGECNFAPYIAANKAVLEVEYSLSTSQFCSAANAANYDAIKKTTALVPGRTACRNG